MKESIEKSIKNSLENHEMPYNGASWTAMQAKLDAKMPVQPKSNFKFYVAASAIIVVAVASFVALNNFGNDSTEEIVKSAQNVDSNVISESNKIENNTTPEIKTNTDDVSTVLTNEIVNQESDSDNSQHSTQANPIDNSSVSEQSQRNAYPIAVFDSNDHNAIGSGDSDVSRNEITSKPIILPTISNVCEGDVIKVENKNNVALVIEGNDLHFIVPANSKRTVRTKSTGNHTISALDKNDSTKSKSFFVKANPAVDFSIDTDTKFEGGIPSTSVQSIVPGKEFSWIFNGQKTSGRTSTAHFYTKGDHEITLTVKGSNGCAASLTKSIYIDQKYNLMAVNSFMPASTDFRKNTFMPYALTERDTKFTLIIIDPIDGHVVYQTNDATAGWNGTDISNGSLVSYESAYIWKVILENPEVNENNEYVGNIIPIDWR